LTLCHQLDGHLATFETTLAGLQQILFAAAGFQIKMAGSWARLPAK